MQIIRQHTRVKQFSGQVNQHLCELLTSRSKTLWLSKVAPASRSERDSVNDVVIDFVGVVSVQNKDDLFLDIA